MNQEVRLRHIAQVNPQSPRFNRLSSDAELTFLPMEAVWPGERLDLSRVRVKSSAETGFTRFQDGDVLVPKITPTFEASRSILVDGLVNGVGAGTTELHVLRPQGECDARYLAYVTHSHRFLKLGESHMYGVAGQQRVPDDFVRDYPIQLPPLDEQQRIAEHIDNETSHLDALVGSTERQLVLINARFIEFVRMMTTTGAGAEAVGSGVPWMPRMNESWQLFRIGRTVLTGSGTTPKSNDPEYFGSEYPWVNTGDLRDSAVYETSKGVTEKALLDYSALRIYPPGTLIVAMYGATTGRTGILGVSGCVNQACCVLHGSYELRLQYLFFWFIAHRSEILGLASGGGQPNISQDMIRSLRVPAPGLPEQDWAILAIREQDRAYKEQRGLLERRLSLLAERRQALITAAVTGQIDVTTARGADL